MAAVASGFIVDPSLRGELLSENHVHFCYGFIFAMACAKPLPICAMIFAEPL